MQIYLEGDKGQAKIFQIFTFSSSNTAENPGRRISAVGILILLSPTMDLEVAGRQRLETVALGLNSY